MPRMTTIRTAPRPMAPYVMRLELSPPDAAELEVSMSVPEDESVVEVPAFELVEVVEEEELVALLLLLLDVVVELHESEQS